MIPENQYYSYNLKDLPKGCQYCVRGEKLVLFVTGICPRKCYYCPLSDKKYGLDVTFANERKVATVADLIKEAELMRAKGAGITRGDPLCKIERTVEYIKVLKEKFGSHFHIHLYTSLPLVTEENLRKLSDAGLDEIRFHPDVDDGKLWERIKLASQFSWDVGIEIPLLPHKKAEIKKLIDYIQDKVKFLNLNELEVADNAMSKLGEMGFETKEQYSYAVKGSVEMGLELIEYVQQKNYPLAVHLCTAKLKDAIQLANRLKREGKYSKLPFDQVDEEGLLTRGALYLPELAPGFDYRKKLETADRVRIIPQLQALLKIIKEKLKFKDTDLYLDESKLRILMSASKLRKKKELFVKMGLKPAVVLEYPTADQLEVEVDFL